MNKLPVTCAAVLATLGLLTACGQRSAPPAEATAKPADAAAKTADSDAEAAAEPHPMPTVAHAAVDLSGIAKAENGQTVAELYADKAKWVGKPVSVRARVVKANHNIMDRNWVHLRDGTGAEGSNDLTVTTKGDVPAVGSTVLVSGTLTTDKDLGAGYKYEVLIEDAKLVAE